MRPREPAVACWKPWETGFDDVPDGGLRGFPFNITILAGSPPETPRHRQRLDKPFDILDTRAIGRPASVVGRAGDVTDGGPDRTAARAVAEARAYLPASVPVDPFGSPASLGIDAVGVKIRAMAADHEEVPGVAPARGRGAAAPAVGGAPQADAAAGATS